MLIGFKWIDHHLKNARNDLTSCGIRSKSCNETNHCCPTIKLFCFRSHKNQLKIWSKYKDPDKRLRVSSQFCLSRELMLDIREFYLIIELIWAECNLFACSLLFAKWLFKSEEIELPLEARLNSDWCNAFLLAFFSSKRIFNSDELEWLGLEDKKSSALWSEFFLQRPFLIKGRWFITFT